MKSIRPALLLVAALVVLAACSRSVETQGSGKEAKTQTIAPASAPSSPNGSDAMTQTVDIEDSRSEAEGGSLNNSQTAVVPVSTATSTAAPKTPAKKKKSK